MAYMASRFQQNIDRALKHEDHRNVRLFKDVALSQKPVISSYISTQAKPGKTMGTVTQSWANIQVKSVLYASTSKLQHQVSVQNWSRRRDPGTPADLNDRSTRADSVSARKLTVVTRSLDLEIHPSSFLHISAEVPGGPIFWASPVMSDFMSGPASKRATKKQFFGETAGQPPRIEGFCFQQSHKKNLFLTHVTPAFASFAQPFFPQSTKWSTNLCSSTAAVFTAPWSPAERSR